MPELARCALLAVAAAVAAGSSACTSTCTMELRYGVWLDVTDATTHEPVGATVTLRDGAYVEVLTPPEGAPPGGSYGGAGERAGVYEITIEAPGYQIQVLHDIVVGEDGCHVDTVYEEVALQPG